MAFCAAEAQPAFTQRGDVGARDGYIRRDFGQHQIEDRRARVHDAAGQAHDGRAVIKIAEQEHRARKDRRAVGDDICTSRLDAARENLAAVIGALEHAMHMIAAEGHDETRK